MDRIMDSQITNYENNSFFPPRPIMFIPFNNGEVTCRYCKGSYSTTILFNQKFCKSCLLLYFKYTANNDLDILIVTSGFNNNCSKHKGIFPIFTQNIQEWCNSCSTILYFKQIVTNNRFGRFTNLMYSSTYKQIFIEYFESRKCNLCGMKSYDQINISNIEFKLCSNCYQISSGWIESTLTKTTVPILYLPWWDTNNQCIACNQFLSISVDCQKWCSKCFIIYVGCKYCLTTNIIFGITDHSQCRRCKKIEKVTPTIINANEINIYSINEVLSYIRHVITFDNYNQIANFLNNININISQLNKYDLLVEKIFYNSRINQLKIKEIPYSQVTKLKPIAEGGFGVIYKANWLGDNVVIKKFNNSQNISKYFLNEVIDFIL
jgi:hypothetical protein